MTTRCVVPPLPFFTSHTSNHNMLEITGFEVARSEIRIARFEDARIYTCEHLTRGPSLAWGDKQDFHNSRLLSHRAQG